MQANSKEKIILAASLFKTPNNKQDTLYLQRRVVLRKRLILAPDTHEHELNQGRNPMYAYARRACCLPEQTCSGHLKS